MIAWILLLTACNRDVERVEAPPPGPHQGPPQAEDRAPGAPSCGYVVSPEGANAIFAVGRALTGVDADCTFEDVHVRGSAVELAFETPGEVKVPATLRVAACVTGEPPAGAFTAGPWLLDVPPASEARCPKGFAALRDALKAGTVPPPSAPE